MKHATQQIANWEQQKQGLEQQLATINNLLQSPLPVYMGPTSALPPQMDPQQQQLQQQPPVNMMPPMDNLMPPGMNNNNNNNNHHEHYSQPPPRNNFFIPDLSRPPPGFGAPGAMSEGGPAAMQAQAHPPPMETAPVPATPYFNLPAGLMAPFIRLEDCSYKSLDPEEIVLPPPTPPSERLLMAVESFYSLPSHERPRDGDGWEKLALYEYYKVKNQAKKQKEESIQKGIRDRSRSPSPIVIEHRVKKAPKRRYRSESRSPERKEGTAAAAPAPVKVSTPSLLDPVDEDRVRSRSRESNSSSGGGGGGGSARGNRHSRDRKSDSPAHESSGRSERMSRGRQRDISPPSTPVIG